MSGIHINSSGDEIWYIYSSFTVHMCIRQDNRFDNYQILAALCHVTTVETYKKYWNNIKLFSRGRGTLVRCEPGSKSANCGFRASFSFPTLPSKAVLVRRSSKSSTTPLVLSQPNMATNNFHFAYLRLCSFFLFSTNLKFCKII